MKTNNMLIIVMSKEIAMSASTESGKVQVPLYNIPMMTDERWNELASRQRLEGKA